MMIWMLVKRNMLLFFKDKSAVFFSLMAVFVVLGLYVTFLGDFMIRPLRETLGQQARELSDTWIMAGTLGTVCLTTSLSVMEIIIEDRSRRIFDDFMITPLKKDHMIAAYFLSTFLITFLVCMVTLVIAELYITYYGGRWISWSTFFQIAGILCIDILYCVSILYFILSFFHSTHAFSNITTIIGTLSGFLMGIYVPIGALPQTLQTLIRLFPPSHGAALLRRAMMADPMERIFYGLPSQQLEAFRINFGLDFHYGDVFCNNFGNIFILLATALLFLFLMWLRRKN